MFSLLCFTRKEINSILRKSTSGLHRDDFWNPIHEAFKKIWDAGFDMEIQNTRYGKNEKGAPSEKVWLFEINLPFSKKPLYGICTAHGAGTVNDPLSCYDISAYVS